MSKDGPGVGDTSVDGGNSDIDHDNRIDTPQNSFANALKNTKSKFPVPDRNQAIIFDAIDNTNKDEYIIATGDIVGPKNIMFASRVSNNRICIYLSSKDIVETFINEKEGITINNNFIKARRLVSPAKRIILSNVSPALPHDVILEEFKKLNLQVVSPMSFIGAGINNPEYKHVLSFRRQIYVILENNDILPESLLISYKENYFRIFISTDEIRCFTCKKLGHVAQKCPASLQETNNAIESITNSELPTDSSVDSQSVPQPDIQSVAQSVSQPGLQENRQVKSKNTEVTQPTVSRAGEKVKKPKNLTPIKIVDCSQSKKRQAPSTTESDTKITEDDINDQSLAPDSSKKKEITPPQFKKPEPKKKKEYNIATEDTVYYKEIEGLFNEKVEVIDFNNFCNFLSDTKGRKDVLDIARSYTSDMGSLLELIVKSIRIVKTNSLKGRLKRIAKKIKRSSETDPDDSTELTSSQEGYTTDTSDQMI